MIENGVAFVWFLKQHFPDHFLKKVIAYHNTKYAEETNSQKHVSNDVDKKNCLFVRYLVVAVFNFMYIHVL